MRHMLMVSAWLGAAVASAEPLTVEAAVQRAVQRSAQVRAARERFEGAGDSARAVRGQLLPGVSVQDEYQHYRGPFSAQLSIPGVPVSPSFEVRAQNTNSLVVAGRQPLLGLLRLSQDYGAALRTEDAADAQVTVAEQSVREQVETGYLRLFEARAAHEVAVAAQAQLADQVAMTAARVQAGSATRADALRVEVARANVEQQALQARVQESAARTLLAALLDFEPGEPLEFAEPVALENSTAVLPSPGPAAVETAWGRRAELTQALRVVDAADATARSRLFALLPEIDASAAWVHVDGQALAEKDSVFIGLKASWPVWVWGAQWFQQRAAAHQANAARLQFEDTRRAVRVEVEGRLDLLESATAAIAVADKALASAEEAFRVTTEVVRAGSGTTTDLLDAQSALTQARLNLVRAKYQQAIARVQARRALGETPSDAK